MKRELKTHDGAKSVEMVAKPTEYDKLALLSTRNLRAELTAGLQITADHLRHLAAIVRILEERGEDLSDLRAGFLFQLRRIAYGQVLPEIVIRYAESPLLLRTVSQLPAPDQERLAAGEPVVLLVPREDGQMDRRLADPAKLTRGQLSQVFAVGKIRDEAEQALLLEDRRSRPASRPQPKQVGTICLDRRRGGLIIGRTFAAVPQVLEALAALSEIDEEAPRSVQVPVPLTEEEHRHLKQMALEGGTTMAQLLRRALGAAGLIGMRQEV